MFAKHRVPTSEKSNHASSLVSLSNNDLLCAWFGGRLEGASDCCIWLCRYESSTKSWQVQSVRVTDDMQQSQQNPVLFVDPRNEHHVFLYYTSCALADRWGYKDTTSRVKQCESFDSGRTWTMPSEFPYIPKTGGLWIRAPIHKVTDTQWLFPAYRHAGSYQMSVVLQTEDGGKTWTLASELFETMGRVQMCIVPMSNNDASGIAPPTLCAFFRSRFADRIYQSIGTLDDLSIHKNMYEWGIIRASSLPNNNSGIAVLRMHSCRFLLVCYNDACAMDDPQDLSVAKRSATSRSKLPYDPKRMPKCWTTKRTPLVIAYSKDDGDTWSHPFIIEECDDTVYSNSSRKRKKKWGSAEFSYPSLAQSNDGMIHLTYTYNRTHITHCMFTEQDVLEKCL